MGGRSAIPLAARSGKVAAGVLIVDLLAELVDLRHREPRRLRRKAAVLLAKQLHHGMDLVLGDPELAGFFLQHQRSIGRRSRGPWSSCSR